MKVFSLESFPLISSINNAWETEDFAREREGRRGEERKRDEKRRWREKEGGEGKGEESKQQKSRRETHTPDEANMPVCVCVMSDRRIPKLAVQITCPASPSLTQPHPRYGPRRRCRDVIRKDLKEFEMDKSKWYE